MMCERGDKCKCTPSLGNVNVMLLQANPCSWVSDVKMLTGRTNYLNLI